MSSTSRLIWVNGCSRPRRKRQTGQGDVELLVELRQHVTLELSLAGGERRLETLADGIQLHAGLPVTHVPQADLQLALAAQPGGVGVGQLPGRGRFRKTLREPCPHTRPSPQAESSL